MPDIDTEVLIVGAGVLGAATARELAKCRVGVTLVEKSIDVGWGITKANVGVVCRGEALVAVHPRLAPVLRPVHPAHVSAHENNIGVSRRNRTAHDITA